jgi:hypothetical protein
MDAKTRLAELYAQADESKKRHMKVLNAVSTEAVMLSEGFWRAKGIELNTNTTIVRYRKRERVRVLAYSFSTTYLGYYFSLKVHPVTLDGIPARNRKPFTVGETSLA